jgi:hypothetical protein
MGGLVPSTVHTQIEGQHGWLKINGTGYEHDVIIHADGRVTSRNCGCSPALRAQLSSCYKEDYFHAPLTEWELDFLQEEEPEVVIVGAGFRCMLPLTPRAKEALAKYEHHVLSTQKAMELANNEGRRFVAILHLSC